MNPRIPIVFALIAVVLAAAVSALDHYKVGQPSATPTPLANGTPIFTFDDLKVQSFTATAQGKTVHFQKQGTDWKIVGDPKPANSTALTSILIRLSQLTGTVVTTDPKADLATYGLDKPSVTAVADLGGGTTYTLQLGKTSPVNTGTYAKASGKTDVYLVPTQLQTDITQLVALPEQPSTPTPAPSPNPGAGASPSALPSGTPAP